MRERFIAWFQTIHPDMDVSGPTGRDEWMVWAQGYTAGMERTIEIYEGKETPVTKLEGVCGL
jgi:hypothetical protein